MALAAVLLSLVPRPLFAAPLVALMAWASGGPLKSAADLALAMDPSYATQIDTLTFAGETIRPEERLVALHRRGAKAA